MTYTISNLAETVANAQALMATLRDLHPILTPAGRPKARFFRQVHIFEVWHQARHTLMCLSPEGEESFRQACVRYNTLAKIQPNCFVPITLHDNEMTIFDACGGARQVAVAMVGHCGECMKVTEFAAYATEVNDREALRTALKDLMQLTAGVRNCGELFDLGVKFTPSGRLIVCEVGKREPRVAEIALTLACALCGYNAKVDATKVYKKLNISRLNEDEKCAALWDMCHIAPDTLCRAIEESTEAATDKPRIVRQRPEREGLRLVESTDGFFYITHEGETMNKNPFVWAEPMREGRAVVQTSEGWGLMQSDGEWCLPPIYEELEWDEVLNICVAMREGNWSLLDREGRTLTSAPYDWIGSPSDGLFPAKRNDRLTLLSTEGREVGPTEIQTTIDYE
ncbi:MAG: WG repeat-containing protein [Rikenellaceae bacterium]|nr:WG repeat-containing protein [Rikenellaceae bacterium]